MRATMLLSATFNGVGVNVRLVGYGLSVSRYQGIYTRKMGTLPSKIMISTPWEALYVDLVGLYTLAHQ